MNRFVPALILIGLVIAVDHAQRRNPPEYTAHIAPFRIVDTIYYVGTADLASYLITTPEGHILIDTGVPENAGTVMDGIRALGFNIRDVRFILTTQAHFDHVGAHARLKEATGARILVAAGDAPIVRNGGKGDFHFGPDYYFPRAPVDGIVTDGQEIRLGGKVLTAHLTPGHTKGTTTWTVDVRDRYERLRHVVFLGSTTVNDGVNLVDNPKYPEIATDYQRTFMTLKALPCDVFLTAHASVFRGPEKAAAAAAGKGEDAFVDPEGCRRAIARSQAAFNDELTRQRANRSSRAKQE